MASQLASQLQRLQQRPVGDKRLSQSFLFDSSESRNFSREQIHQLAVHGLQTLVAIDNRFHPFLEELFHPYKTRLERSLLSSEENQSLNVLLEQFLTLLSPHMFLTAAHQVFEYLVRVHEIHVYNVEGVLRAFLPYHDHSLFARAVMLLDLRDTGFAFLQSNQEHGAPLPREHLILACAESRKALRLVCMTLAMSVRMKVHNSASNALFTGVAVGLASHPSAESLWRVLLPFIMEFLSGAVSGSEKGDAQQELKLREDTQGSNASLLLPSREVVCGALVVVSAWSSEVEFSVLTLTTVIKPIIQILTRAAGQANSASSSAVNSVVAPTSDLLAVIDLLFFTQRKAVTQVTFAPQIQLLLSLPWKQWAPWITAACEEVTAVSGRIYDSLIAVLLRQCLQRLRVAHSLESVAPDVLHFLECAMSDLPLTDALVSEAIQTLMVCHVQKSTTSGPHKKNNNGIENIEEEEESNAAPSNTEDILQYEGRSLVTTWLRTLERRFAHVFDTTLSRLLNDVATQAHTVAFLAQHLTGTRYELLEVQGSSGKKERLPLFSCLLHPLPEVRLLAVKTMDTMTCKQLLASSSAHGSSGTGNSLLELFEHVIQYEHSHKVAEHFLHSAATTIEKLFALLMSKETEEEEAERKAMDGVLASMERRVIVPHLRNILRSLWAMVTQHDMSVHKMFHDVILLPLLQLAGSCSSNNTPMKKRGSKKQNVINGTDAFHGIVRSVAIYYLTLQYVDAVHKETTGSLTKTAEGEKTDADHQLRELIAELERQLTSVVPDIGRKTGFFTLQEEIDDDNSRATNGNENDVTHRDGDDEDDDNGTRWKRRSKQLTSSSTEKEVAAGGAGECKYLSVFECMPLLQLLREESSIRLQSSLAQLRAKAEGAEGGWSCESRTAVLECCLACASQLTTTTVLETTGVIQMLLKFFVGENLSAAGSSTGVEENGYLDRLREAQRAAAQRVKGKIGRGATSTLATPYLPKDELTATIGATVRYSTEARLRNNTNNTNTNTNNNDNNNNKRSECDEVTMLERMSRLLGYLSTPLPALAVHPTRLSPVYLRLLEPTNVAHEEERFPVDWFNLVYTSVFRTHGCMKVEKKKDFLLSALSLSLLCPLAAPTSRKESVLQEIQSIVLTTTQDKRGSTSTSTRKGKSNNSTTLTMTARTTGARMAIESALFDEHISATTLSAIIESMSREESRGHLTQSASELLCCMITEMCEGQKDEPVVPFAISCRAIEHFFPIKSKGNRNETVTSGIAMKILLPVLKSILMKGGSTSNSNTSSSSSNGSKSKNKANNTNSVTNGGGENDNDDVGAAVSSSAADFLNAACTRGELGVLSDDGEDAFLTLCLSLIRYPFLRVIGGRVRPVYRHALTAFAVILSRGSAGQQSNSLLFIPNGGKDASTLSSSRGGKKPADGEKYLHHILPIISKALLNDGVSMNRLGADATLLLAGTVGGYQRLFLPWVSHLLQQSSPDLSIVVDVMETLAALATETAYGWEPPSWCVLHNPLSFADAQNLLKLCGKLCDLSQKGKRGECPLQRKNALLVLRLLCSLISVSPSINFDEEDDDDDDHTSSSPLFVFIDGLLETFPLSGLLSLLTEADDAESDGVDQIQFHRSVFMYIRSLVNLCILSPQALNEGQPQGAAHISRTLVKQCVTLMAALLVPDVSTKQVKRTSGEEEEEAAAYNMKKNEEAELSRYRIDTIAELLRIVSPLFASASTSSLSSGKVTPGGAGRSALHIPVVALLIRLEGVDFASAHQRYESAMDVCSSLLTSFDVHTQLTCLAQMMYLLIDPHQQLSLTATQKHQEGGDDNEEKNGDKEEKADDVVVKLFRKLVKPNQVVNRQEMILNLINTTVKSEAFLSEFLELQHRQSSSHKLHAKQDNDENMKEEENTYGTGKRTRDECMSLLVASLELFAHYTELNADTANDVVVLNEMRRKETHENAPEYSESKAFTMLLELLAGNTLACVLAGINEPTFVMCLERLLTDQRVVLQNKGLEVLLDRLHHALPTVESTLSESEIEEHRQLLRDPKRKLTLMDLVRVKARPLVTKRSFGLFPHLSSLMNASVKSANTKPTCMANLLHILPLTVGCMEELVRIVGSGGSLQAEKTLLNVHRANRVTEAVLSKLFGNKARVQEVHQWVDDITALVQTLLSGDKTGAVGGEYTTRTLMKDEDTLIAVAALLTALGTVCQVMGVAFTTRHSNNILTAVVNTAMFAVMNLTPHVSRGEAGSLLRQSSLSCLLRVFPSCWLMCQPYLPRIIFAATHLHNVDDTETNYRSAEILAMLEAVLEPHLFIEACAECLRGVGESSKRTTMKVRVDSHSFSMLYTSVQRRVQSLKREELLHLNVLVEGTTVKDNFWLSSLYALATAQSLPSRDIVQPVLEAYTAFFLKFKANHCARYLSTVAEWAFDGAAENFLKRIEEQQKHQREDEDVTMSEDLRDTHKRDDAALVSRTAVHGWVLFYALCNHLLEKLGSIMDFGFPVILPYAVGTLTGYCSAAQHSMKHAAGLIALALEGGLDCVRRMALAQTAGPDHDHSIPVDNHLEAPEVFAAVMPAVVRQLTNISYLADSTHNYAFRAEHHVIPAVRAVFQSLTSSKLQGRMQNELLKALRHPSRHVRRMTLLCLDGIYADGGDELASRLMAEMLPAVVEMTEDRDDDVVEQARKFCNNLSAITGQDVLYAMSS